MTIGRARPVEPAQAGRIRGGQQLTPQFSVRPFEIADLPAVLTVCNDGKAPSPEYVADATAKYEEWPSERCYRLRWVAENRDLTIVGWGEIAHNRWQFHPDKYWLRVEVARDRRRQGAGGLLLAQLMSELQARGALLARTRAFEGDAERIGFFAHRRFREVWRELESRLDVAAFEPEAFADAGGRVAAQGVTITTLAAEMERDPGVLLEVYETSTVSQDDRQLDPLTPPPFEEFAAGVLGADSLLDAWFLALMGGRIVGVSSLERIGDRADEIEVGYTGIHPDYRRRGIALALKLRTIAYARERGYRYILTGSNAVNTPMLSLNAALGFEPLPARITLERALDSLLADRTVRIDEPPGVTG